MKPNIDMYLFEKYFELFLKLVEAKSKTKFISFPSNRYTEENEGYKDDIYEKARLILQFWKWNQEEIGKGEIFAKCVRAIKLEKSINNLVDWRIVSKFEDKLKDRNNILYFEDAIYNFFNDEIEDEKIFEKFIKFFGKKYPLIAYLFFIKDKAQYMPISPLNFDIAFKNLGVQNFKTSHQCSWENYIQYNKLLSEIRELLLNKGIKDVSLLNAHSYVWIISRNEKEFENVENSRDRSINAISKYLTLGKKDREAIVKARIGQGYFRDQLINYWDKCCVTGCQSTSILVASHIKPWKDCNTNETIDLYNGLLLTPNIDKLLDRGLISFSDTGKILLSSQISDDDFAALGISKNIIIRKLKSGHFKYLEYHRNRIFLK